MNKDNINTVVHRWLKEFLQPHHVCIDGTCGNGNDTLFLAERTQKVYGFDIQSQAIENTKTDDIIDIFLLTVNPLSFKFIY